MKKFLREDFIRYEIYITCVLCYFICTIGLHQLVITFIKIKVVTGSIKLSCLGLVRESLM